jgi:chloramphenicol-sensitive protein RarD
MARSETKGLLYGLAAYGLWGLVPLYFNALSHVAPEELLAQRIIWSVVLLSALMSAIRGWGLVRSSLTTRSTRRTLLSTSVLIGINWYLYIYAATHEMLVEASLGYFITPLVNAVLGLVVLHERLRTLQRLAILLAALGVAVLTLRQGHFPGLALGLAGSFSLYGLFRKTVQSDALTGLTIESLVLMVPAGVYLAFNEWRGTASFGHVDRVTDLLLMAASVVTVTPLFCFAQAARRLRLTTIGFLQFLSPSIQLLLAVAVLGEPFDRSRLYGFVPIWLALIVYTLDAVVSLRRARIDQLEVLPAANGELASAEGAKTARSSARHAIND